MVEIREAQDTDISSLVLLEQACFSDAWQREGLLSHWQNEACRTYIATEEGEVLGALLLSCLPPEGEIFRLAVKGSARRRGLGARLMRHGMAELFSAGVRRLYLDVRAGNRPAISLYLSLGFAEYGRRARYYRRPCEDAILMERELSLDDISRN